jgi:hypothetical protein
MFKSLKEIAGPMERSLSAELSEELAEFEKLLRGCDDSESYELEVKVLSTGRRVYCPNRQNPIGNRKHHIRSLLIR